MNTSDVLKLRKPHQRRVAEEWAELGDKIAKLDAFLNGDTLVDERELGRLQRQRLHMGDYHAVLAERMGAWPRLTKQDALVNLSEEIVAKTRNLIEGDVRFESAGEMGPLFAIALALPE